MLVCVVGVLDMEMAYPLVNMQKNCGKAPCFMAKSTINGQFSIVTSKCRRVYPLVDNAFLLLCVTYFQMVFVQQAMFVYQLDGCIENDFKRPHPKFFLKLMISEQKKSWPETQAGFTLNVPWMFHGNSPGNATAFHGSMGPGTEKLPDLWCGISGWQLAFRDGTLIIQVNYRYMFCYM